MSVIDFAAYPKSQRQVGVATPLRRMSRALPTYQLTLGPQLADSGSVLEKHAGLATPASARSSQQASQQGSRPYQGLGVPPVPGEAGIFLRVSGL